MRSKRGFPSFVSSSWIVWLTRVCERRKKPLGGASEVQLLAEGEEDVQLAQFNELPHQEEILIAAARKSPLFGAAPRVTMAAQ